MDHDRFSVLIPWRTDNGPREVIFEWIVQRYLYFYGDNVQLCIADSGHDPFNRAASRNKAFNEAVHDVILIADADTPPQRDFVRAFRSLRLFDLAYSYPYKTYYALKQELTERLLRSSSDVEIPSPSPVEIEFRMESWAGSICMTKKSYEAVNGYDERFIGWGYEDTAFREACSVLLTESVRLPGHVVHMWHPFPKEETWEQPDIKNNEDLFAEYERAGSPPVMQSLVDSRYGLTDD